MKEEKITPTLMDKQGSENTLTEKETLDISELTGLHIRTNDVDIKVSVHKDPTIDVVLETYENGPVLTTDLSNRNGEIIVESPRPRTFSFFQRVPYCQLRIAVPGDIVKEWDAESGSGDISLSDLTAESLEVNSGSGDVILSNLIAVKSYAKTASGDITARNLKVNDLQFQSASGDVEFMNVYGNTAGTSTSGDVVLSSLQGEKLDIKTTSGDIHLRKIRTSHAICQATSGSIAADDMTTEKLYTTASSGDLEYRKFSGNIKGHASSGDALFTFAENGTVDFGTSSGDVTMIFAGQNPDASVNITTRSGDITSRLPMTISSQSGKQLTGMTGEGKHSVRLRSNSGDVEILCNK
ncbi:DUF4097 family beta strand repeat-containing protein [Lentibacillus salicampi]|nr:DUF4097 family beta strand repeat-containing protein [Lentibacillus salicampi]